MEVRHRRECCATAVPAIDPAGAETRLNTTSTIHDSRMPHHNNHLLTVRGRVRCATARLVPNVSAGIVHTVRHPSQ